MTALSGIALRVSVNLCNVLLLVLFSVFVFLTLPLWAVELVLADLSGSVLKPKFVLPTSCTCYEDWVFLRQSAREHGQFHMVRLFGVEFSYLEAPRY